MKYFPVALLLCALAFAACSGSSGSNDGATTSSSETFRYRFIDGSCDTGPRLAISRDQFCRNLQFQGANNECALDERKKRFQENCSGTWDPDSVRKAIDATPGAHVNCYISDGGDATFGDIVSGKRYVNHQYTVDPLTVIPHDNFVAVVSQSLKNGTFNVHVKLLTDYPNGTLIAEGDKNWQDRDPDDALQVDGTSPKSRATCYPKIH